MNGQSEQTGAGGDAVSQAAQSSEPGTPAATAQDATAPDAVAAEGVRGRLVRQFERWLDRMTAGEELPPEGLPEELAAAARAAVTGQAGQPGGSAGAAAAASPDCDLYTLFSALTTLSGEVRLQGRAFKQLTDALASLRDLPARLDDLRAAQSDVAERVGRLAEELPSSPDEPNAALPSSKEVLAVLFDLRERLERGLRTLDAALDTVRAEAPHPVRGWRRLLGGGPAPASATTAGLAEAGDAMREGYRLTLSRLEAALQQWGIERLGAAGEAFDPQTMAAVDVGPPPDGDDGERDGTVLEVYRSGYALHGEVLATAQVKVAKASRKDEGEG